MRLRSVSGLCPSRLRCACWVLTFAVILALSGCAKKIPHTLVEGYEKVGIKTIAVLPVVDEAGNKDASVILRQRVIDALYFKGHPKMPASVIDEKLGLFFKNVKVPKVDALPPRDAGGILGADAVLYTTLKECRVSYLLLSASTKIAATFELYNVRTGKLLWQTSYRINEKNYDITRDRLRLKTSQTLEPALQQILDTVLKTLPDPSDI